MMAQEARADDKELIAGFASGAGRAIKVVEKKQKGKRTIVLHPGFEPRSDVREARGSLAWLGGKRMIQRIVAVDLS